MRSTGIVPDKAPAGKPWKGTIVGLGPGTKNHTPKKVWVWFHGNEGYEDTENLLLTIHDMQEDLHPDCIPEFLKDSQAWLKGKTIAAAREFFNFKTGQRMAVQFGKSLDNSTILKFQSICYAGTTSQSRKITLSYDDKSSSHTNFDPLHSSKAWRLLLPRLDDKSDLQDPELNLEPESDDSINSSDSN